MTLASRLLIGPYLNPTDAARIAWWLAFMTGLAAGMLLGWAGTLSALAIIKYGVLQ